MTLSFSMQSKWLALKDNQKVKCSGQIRAYSNIILLDKPLTSNFLLMRNEKVVNSTILANVKSEKQTINI